ncbi:MAG: TraR/DksA family transcriptional regulator [Crenarchaeota archaeon]|nr:MAG: TraR/DksA family transcriptional regulator [Thermoproteota archaeon]
MKKINKKDRDALKERLIVQRDFLQAVLKGELDNLANFDRTTMFDDLTTGAQECISHDIQAGLGENAAVELASIKAALKRIDTPEFGICEECNKPIATNRLKAIPHVSTCLKCQAELESEG